MKYLFSFLFLAAPTIFSWVSTFPSYHLYALSHWFLFVFIIVLSCLTVLWILFEDAPDKIRRFVFLSYVLFLLFAYPNIDDLLYADQKIFEKAQADALKKDDIARYTGRLIPRADSVIFDSTNSSARPGIQIGRCSTKLLWSGPPGEPLIKLPGSRVIVEMIDGKVKLTTSVTDSTGTYVAELIQNEWNVIPPPGIFDRNYDDSSVEVIDRTGKVIIQITALIDVVQIQGDFRGDNQEVMLVCDKKSGSGSMYYIPPSTIAADKPSIDRLFAYPSELHMHQFAKF